MRAGLKRGDVMRFLSDSPYRRMVSGERSLICLLLRRVGMPEARKGANERAWQVLMLHDSYAEAAERAGHAYEGETTWPEAYLLSDWERLA